jgi:hypothetical protein
MDGALQHSITHTPSRFFYLKEPSMNPGYPIIDADGHVLEKERELHDYLCGR